MAYPTKIEIGDVKVDDDRWEKIHGGGDTSKPPQPSDFGGDMEKYLDALNQHMKDVETKLKKESVRESVSKKFTVKEVQKWMKTLEENRYKRVYNSDCRRVAWMTNNMKENVANMPKSMRKKWTKAQYGRERYLAKEFLKSKLSNLKEQFTEQKFRKVIRKSIKNLMEGPAKYGHRWEIPMKDKKKVKTIVKKLKVPSNDYAIYGSGRTFEMEISASKLADKVLELLIKNKIKVQDV